MRCCDVDCEQIYWLLTDPFIAIFIGERDTAIQTCKRIFVGWHQNAWNNWRRMNDMHTEQSTAKRNGFVSWLRLSQPIIINFDWSRLLHLPNQFFGSLSRRFVLFLCLIEFILLLQPGLMRWTFLYERYDFGLSRRNLVALTSHWLNTRRTFLLYPIGKSLFCLFPTLVQNFIDIILYHFDARESYPIGYSKCRTEKHKWHECHARKT